MSPEQRICSKFDVTVVIEKSNGHQHRAEAPDPERPPRNPCASPKYGPVKFRSQDAATILFHRKVWRGPIDECHVNALHVFFRERTVEVRLMGEGARETEGKRDSHNENCAHRFYEHITILAILSPAPENI